MMRALYVHSVGLYNLLKDSMSFVKEGKEALITNFWKVFLILLENTCKGDYTMVI